MDISPDLLGGGAYNLQLISATLESRVFEMRLYQCLLGSCLIRYTLDFACIAGADPEFGKGGCTLLKRLKTKKKKAE